MNSSSDQNQLQSFISEMDGRSTGWHAIHISISRLVRREARGPMAGKIAGLLKVAGGKHGRIAHLANHDMLFMIQKPDDGLIKKLCMTIEAVLLKAPRIGNADYCNAFSLDDGFSDFVASIAGIPDQSGNTPLAEDNRVIASAGVHPVDEDVETLSPQEIAKVEHLFYKANVTNFIRNQTVYKWSITRTAKLGRPAEGKFVEAFDEMFVSISHLSEHMQNKFAIADDRWLFQHLTRTLDERLLIFLGENKGGEKKKIAYSVNLNVKTIFSEAFINYDSSLPGRVRKGQVIEFQAFDLIQNLKDFFFLKSILTGRGYRVAVDGIDRYHLELIRWERMGVDLLKLKWDPALREDNNSHVQDRVRAFMAPESGGQVVLYRCDDQDAVDWGLETGITLFQGWHLDGLHRKRPDH